MKLFSFPRVNQVIPADTRHMGYETVAQSDDEAPQKAKPDDQPVSNVTPASVNGARSGEDRRRGNDRRQTERAPSSVAILFDTRAKIIRRKTSRRHEDDEQLQNFSIKI